MLDYIIAHMTGVASAIVGGIILVILGFAWLWQWAIRHEADIMRRWERLRSRARIVALRRRFAAQTAFVQARLLPQSYLGLSLTIGALLLIGASWLFGGILQDVLNGDPLTVVDEEVAKWFHARTTSPLTQVMLFITHLNGIASVSVYVLAMSAYLIWKRDGYWLKVLVITVPGGMLINLMMKYAVHRARPSFADPILTLTTYSFPSGHVAASTLLYGVLAAYLVTRVGAWRWRVLVSLGALLIIVMVALSRIYLGVHYLSDVLAAFAEGVAWLALCLTAMHTLRQRRARR